MRRSIRMTLIIIGLSLVIQQAVASAQDDFGLWINQKPNDFTFMGDVGGLYYWETDVDDDDTDFRMSQAKASIRYLLKRPDSEWIFSAKAQGWHLDSDARFDESGEKLPGKLEDYGLGTTYRRFMDNGWIVGQNLQVGTASDTPFASIDEMYAKGTTFLTIPNGQEDFWVFLLNFDTHRPYPVLPGIGYQTQLRDNLSAMIGLPFLSLSWQPCDRSNVQLTYIPVKNIDARVSYRILDPLTLSLGLEWDAEYFHRHDAENWDDLIEYEEMRARLAARYSLSESLSIEIGGGYAFARNFGEGDSYSDRSDNDIDIDDGWFADAKLNWKI